MPTQSPSPSDDRLRRYLIVSLVLHALLAGAITFALFYEHRDVLKQEEAFIEEIVKEEQRLAEQQRQARQEATKSMMADQALAEMEQLVDDELRDEDEQQLLEQTSEFVDEQLSELDPALDLDALHDEQYAQIAEDLRNRTFEQMRADLRQMKQDLLISQVRSYIRERVAPDIQQQIEDRLKQRVGEHVRNQASAQAHSDQRQREKQSDRDPAEEDDITRKVVEEAMTQVDEAMREKVADEVKRTAVPTAADRLVKALDRELKRQGLEDKAFREFVEKDIKRALEEETNKRQPEAELATAKTQRQFDLQSPEELEEASREVAEVAAKLEALAKQQERLREDVPDESPSQDAIKQHALADEVRQTREQADRTLAEAAKATLDNDKAVREAQRRTADEQVNRTAVEAARALQREVNDDAKRMMKDVADELAAEAKALRDVEAKLAAEAEAMKQTPIAEVDLKKELGEEQAETAVQRVAERAEQAADKRLKAEVAAAARSVDVSDVLNNAQTLEAAQQMAALEDRLEQIAANMAEGRELADMIGLGMIGPGQGIGPGGLPSVEDLEWTVPNAQSQRRMNMRAYEEFVKDIRSRLDPENYYDDAEQVEQIATRAAPVDSKPSVMFVSDQPPTDAPDEPAEDEPKRRVPQPEFPTLAFGAAPMMQQDVTIDGDLSDWGELTQGLELRYIGSQLEKVDAGPTVYMRWSPDGLYFGYTVDDPNGIQPNPEQSWDGDCIEIMIDMANSKRESAYENIDAQKFQLTPFGAKGNKDLRVWEMGRGLRGLRMAVGYPDEEGVKGHAAATDHGGSYTVEGFISRRALSKPLLVPGKYVGLNFSLNRGGDATTYQWSASQQLQSWRRPDTWGDVLLLGSDAKLAFITAMDDDQPVEAVVPGDLLHVQVTDADMNLNTRKTDRVSAQLYMKSGASTLFVVLEETGVNTGVFRASVNTQPYFMEPREDTLNVRSGESIELHYTDARTEYGEKDRRLSMTLPVGWAVMQMGGK